MDNQSPAAAQPDRCDGCSGAHRTCVCHPAAGAPGGARRGALLLNLGTPDSTSVADVRRYLRQFLSDRYVLDFGPRWDWLRPPLARLIAHFRGPRSAGAYQSIWREDGSPLKIITERQAAALQKRLPGGWSVYYAMRYASPPIRDVLKRIVNDRITDLVVVPMYPQWSGPTTGTALEELYREVARAGAAGGLRLNLTVRTDWYDDANYIDAQARIIHEYARQRGLHPGNALLLHSTHSLPTVYVQRGDPYEGHVRCTMALVNRRLGWPEERSAIGFQSKLGPVSWLSPSTEDLVKELAAKGEKNLLVCPISFTADCLETLEEIGMQYAELFERESGGGKLHLIPAPNDSDEFIDALTHLVRSRPHRLRHDAQFDEPLLGDGSEQRPLAELIELLTMVGVSKQPVLPVPDGLQVAPVADDVFRSIKQPQQEAVHVLRRAKGLDDVDGCWLLNTCQRYELYIVREPSDGNSRAGTPAGMTQPGELASLIADETISITSLHGRDAWRHLLRTAAGLNSPLPGDADVLRQLDSARRVAEHAGAAGASARRLIDAAGETVRRLGRETSWSDHATEYCQAAIGPLVGSIDLEKARILVVGGSVTTQSLLRLLVDEHDVAGERLTVIYRGAGRKRLARALQRLVASARHIAVEDYQQPNVIDAIAEADVLFLGIDRREPMLRAEHLQGLRDFASRPLSIIDFNTHGSTEGLDALAGVHVTSASCLEEHVERHVERMLSSEGFQRAWQEAEDAITALAHDPEAELPTTSRQHAAAGSRGATGIENADQTQNSELRTQSSGSGTALPVIDRDSFEKYTGLSVPRHVAYPMPTWWREVDAKGAAEIRAANLELENRRDLSLYLHLPFCEKLCKFCACNRTILRKDGPSAAGRVERYLSALHEEMRRRAMDLGARRARPVRQIHWGGGTPTYLDRAEIEALHRLTCELFDIAPDAEVSIEVDPRVTTREQLSLLRDLGFNRISMGVQDFDRIVQEHVGRVQPLELVAETVTVCRDLGFPSINFDLIYGLPYQTVQSVDEAVAHTINLGADRVAFYHYAQIPERIANQRKLHHHAMPDSGTKLQMFLGAVARFEQAGYEFIGLDHFARPDEGLAQAMREGRITRNFQGMSTGAELDLAGMGCSAISCLPGRGYLQNVHEPDQYAGRIEAGAQSDPAVRGLMLTRDDAIRQAVLRRLYCDARLDAQRISRQLDIDFAGYFHDELERLRSLEDDGLVRVSPDGSVELTFPLGRVLMRNVAAVFDAYLDSEAFRFGQKQVFSASA